MADSFSFPADQYVLIGKISKAHGIRGELKLIPYSGDSKSITRHKSLTLITAANEILPSRTIKKCRAGGKAAIVLLEGINNRNQSEELTGCGVLVAKTALPRLQEEEFYLHELEGVEVKTVEGAHVGVVDAFFDNGSQDILVVKQGKQEFLIPLIPGMITQRDNSCLTIAPPPGLLEINSEENSGKL